MYAEQQEISRKKKKKKFPAGVRCYLIILPPHGPLTFFCLPRVFVMLRWVTSYKVIQKSEWRARTVVHRPCHLCCVVERCHESRPKKKKNLTLCVYLRLALLQWLSHPMTCLWLARRAKTIKITTQREKADAREKEKNCWTVYIYIQTVSSTINKYIICPFLPPSSLCAHFPLRMLPDHKTWWSSSTAAHAQKHRPPENEL